MTKQELIRDIASNTDHSQTVVEEVLEDFAGLVSDELKAGNEVVYPKLGKFEPVHQPQRQGRNPATGQAMMIAAKVAVKFRPAAQLKRHVNGE